MSPPKIIKMTKIIKEDGSTEFFSALKLKDSIKKSAKDAKISRTETNQLIKEITNPVISSIRKRKLIKSNDIKKSLLQKLKKTSKPVSDAWEKFEKSKSKK